MIPSTWDMAVEKLKENRFILKEFFEMPQDYISL